MLCKVINGVFLHETKYLSQKWFSSKSFYPQNLNGKLSIIGVPFGKGQVRLLFNEQKNFFFFLSVY